MYKKNIFHYIYIFASLFLFDRYSKFWVLHNLGQKTLNIFDGLNFSLILNRGVSFGLLNSSSVLNFYFLTSLIFLVISFFVFYSILEYKQGNSIFWHIFIILGAYSNILDRFLYTGVVDFIDIYFKGWHWPTFNFADIYILIGVIGILGGMFKNVSFKKN